MTDLNDTIGGELKNYTLKIAEPTLGNLEDIEGSKFY